MATSDYSYDSAGRLTGIDHHQGDTVLASYAYSYEDGADGGQYDSPLLSGEGPGVRASSSAPSGVLLPFHDPSSIDLAMLDQAIPAADQIASVASADGTVNYSYDPSGQLTGASYSTSESGQLSVVSCQLPTNNGPRTTDLPPNESYSFDANGDRTGAGYVIGPDNQVLCDGTYAYMYDAEGNRTAKFIDANSDGVLDSGDTSVTIYGWDNRNRLVSVTSYAAYGDAPTQTVTYSYDAQNRWIGETVTGGLSQVSSDETGTVPLAVHATAFAYDPEAGGGGGAGTGQIVLQFDGDCPKFAQQNGTVPLTVANLSHRYLWGPAVDQILADEQLSPLPPGATTGVVPEGEGGGYDLTQPGTVVWPLTDNLGTARDLAIYNAATGVTSVANHRVYDSFGNLNSQTNAAVGCIFGFTGKPLDPAGTGLQNNNARIYDAALGDWLSRDPTSFTAGDTNTSRYAGSSPTSATDPSGQIIVVPGTQAAALSAYITSVLGWQQGTLFTQSARPDGSAVFSIPGGTSTLNLWGQNGINTLQKEILAAMLTNGREIDHTSALAVQGEVECREQIVQAAKDVRFPGFPADGSAHFDENYFFKVPMGPKKGFHKTKPFMEPFKALRGAACREANETWIGCDFSTGWTVVLGIARWARANPAAPDLYRLDDANNEAERYPYDIANSAAWITTIQSVPSNNWIPGDWVESRGGAVG